jgi:hypothetical protein
MQIVPLMKIHVLLILLTLVACKPQKPMQISLPKNVYRLVKTTPEDLEDLKKVIVKSKTSMEIDFDSGEFTGLFEKIKFNGKYKINRVSAGISKGFNYELELEALQTDATTTKSQEKFFEHIVNASTIFVGPNKLYKPEYMEMRVKSGEEIIKLYMLF